ncbi:MAG: ammonium transporter, partial [Candidatus Hydrogenedentes bacterium]|nr:ammonium transporter [Candidatus Hydrogenedentota bacterium]
MGMGKWRPILAFSLLALALLGAMPESIAQEDGAVVVAVDAAAAVVGPTVEDLQNNLNIVWTCMAAFLVFFMQAGFAMVETGFTRAKNVVNIIMKNLMDFSIGSLAFFMIGFGIMFGLNNSGFFGTSDFFLNWMSYGDDFDGQWPYTFLIFQTVFAATAATIVSGAMAERTKFTSYLVYSVFISAFIYPISGSWAWNSLYADSTGWLENIGFLDFAGSTVVHSVGGWLALAGALVLGPRIG